MLDFIVLILFNFTVTNNNNTHEPDIYDHEQRWFNQRRAMAHFWLRDGWRDNSKSFLLFEGKINIIATV